MATKVPKSARFTITLDAGLHPVSGNQMRKSASFGNLVPNAAVNDVDAVATSISSMFVKPVLSVSITEVNTIV